MKPLEDLPAGLFSGIDFVLSDIDDTMTHSGKLEQEAYQALWELKAAGLVLLPVTGRPAGWCDLIARQWPVDGVIGENGAFVFYEEDGTLKHFYHPQVAGPEAKEKLSELTRAVFIRFPLLRPAKDQFARMFDLAIDFREEEPRYGFELAEEVKDFCLGRGAQAKVSSIHVNTWYGDYNKLSMARSFLESRYGLDEEAMKQRVLYVGDSPNDEPMFSFFPHSCGVANVKDFIKVMKSPPSYVSSLPGGRGFAQFARKLLTDKS